ncbi:YcxB family protein [Streptomyces sp. NPDC006512]|uniref:YcxB family protein n=1 Tax=Streptomyces sp. NPDC006512 TaxID=3154307 RepID=UPI0033A8EE61
MDTAEQVELSYRSARADVREALRWRALAAPGGRRELLLWLVLVPLVAPVIIVLRAGRATDPAGLAVAAGAGVLCGALGLLLDRWRAARRLYARASERGYRCVVTELGMSSHRPDGTVVAHRWAQYTGWAETRNLFVFVYCNGHVGWLPKRAAAAPGDIDRIRAVLDRNLARI